MPDVRDGHILAEDLIAGQWDWNCLGCFLFLAVAIVIPGAGWGCIALAALALWLWPKAAFASRKGTDSGHLRRDRFHSLCHIQPRNQYLNLLCIQLRNLFHNCFTTCFTNRA